MVRLLQLRIPQPETLCNTGSNSRLAATLYRQSEPNHAAGRRRKRARLAKDLHGFPCRKSQRAHAEREREVEEESRERYTVGMCVEEAGKGTQQRGELKEEQLQRQ